MSVTQITTASVNILLAESALPATDTAGMAKKSEPPKPTMWTIYKLAARQERLGTIEAPDEAAASKRCGGIWGEGQPADGDPAMTRRKGESPATITES
jgi:hypothetical protein